MVNLKEETIKAIEDNGAFIDEIEWIGLRGFFYNNENGKIPIKDFWQLADFEYDDGYGSACIPLDLVVVGSDWWLERREYDGAEWWSFKKKPVEPTSFLDVEKLTDLD